MVCGPLLETLNTCGPLRGYKIVYSNDLHHKSEGFFPRISIEDQKKRSPSQIEVILPQISMSKEGEFFFQCPVAPG